MIRVAVDAMGGDTAPQAEIAGVHEALRAPAPEPFAVHLVGRRDAIEAELARYPDLARDRVEIHDAPDVIGMGEKPLAAVRKKPRSSLVVGLELHASGRSDALISAGNTGATLAGSTLLLGLHEGVERATVATLFPTAGRSVLVLDAGANVDCSARELVGFAHLGSVYMRALHGRTEPVVGLLNVGEEEEKGNAVVKEAHQLLKTSRRLRYAGNIEGRDIVAGAARGGPLDVVVCDGFVGNVVLKFYEAAGRFFVALLRERVPEAFERPAMRDVVRFLDYSEYGGAPLLGVRGIPIICHGSSSANSFKHAILFAVAAAGADLSGLIGAELAQREAAARV